MIDQLHYISQQQGDSGHIETIKKALDAGCKWIQLRVKNQPESVVKSLATEAKKLCDSYDAKLIINDFPHIAMEVNAYGVHLGLLDMTITEARDIVGNEMIIGGTANTFEHIIQRVNEGANYVGLGPFRFTRTKEKLSPVLGLEGYQTIMKRLKENNIQIPIIAIGGLEVTDVEWLRATGIHGVALSGTITFSNDPKATVNELHSALKGCLVN